MAHELILRNTPFEYQLELPVNYKGRKVDCGYRVDLWVGRKVIVELKAVSSIEPIHEAQLLTYLKLTGCKVGLILNFNVIRMNRGGIKRMVLNL